MDISTIEFAALAADVYRDRPKDSKIFRWSRQNFFGDPDNGFFAAAFHHRKSKSMVVAFRGSGGDLGDWLLSGNVGNFMGVKKWDSQLNTARNYFQTCAKLYSPGSVAVCGHSLGGFLAAMIALEKGVSGVTFDRPTLGYSAFRVANANASKLFNFRAEFDPVSATRDGFGRWATVNARITENIVAGRGRLTLSHSMDHLYEALLLHPRGDLPPAQWPWT